MATEQNLYEQLHGHEVDQSELEQVLLTYFGLASAPTPEAISYQHTGEHDSALTLRYHETELVAVYGGPGLRDNDLPALEEKIGRQLLAPGQVRVARHVMFSYLPVTGAFRYKDAFQFLPVPPDAPRPDFLLGDHPLLLEARFESSEEAQLRFLRRGRALRQIELVCGAIAIHLREGLGSLARHHWILPDSGAPEWRSRYCQEMYTWPGLVLEADEFTSIDGVPEIALAPAGEYYRTRGISPGEPLTLPDVFPDLLDRFFARSRVERDRFLRAAFWYQHAQRAGSYSRSAAFIALVSAVETLVPRSLNKERCETCGMQLGPGATQRFIEFVEAHAPSPAVTTKERKELYRLRSALAHGGKLLHVDRVNWASSFTSESVRQFHEVRTLGELVRTVLVNWLYDHAHQPRL